MNEAPANVPSATEAVLLSALPLQRRTRVVDVGANPLADEAPYAHLLKIGACDVVGFEPQPEAFAALEKIKSDRETYLPFAVGDGSKQTLNVYQSSGYTSVFKPYREGFRFIGGRGWAQIKQQIPFETVKLDDSADIGPFDLLKIDIQGGELAVFRGGETTLKQAMVVIVEMRYYPLYKREPMLGGVDTELRRQGFFMHKLLTTKSKMIKNSQHLRLRKGRMHDQILDGDAVYLRDLARIDSYSDDQLVHLCITAGAVFHSHTLVLHVLDELVRRGRVPADLPSAYVDAMPASLRTDG
ncbi:MAG: FkbM family methyltransferase [Paracoccaceae bacterium]